MFTWVTGFVLFLLAFFDFFSFSWDINLELPSNPLFYFLAVVAIFVWIGLIIQGLRNAIRLKQMHWFYFHKLDIKEVRKLTNCKLKISKKN
jgi:hypothetical protein